MRCHIIGLGHDALFAVFHALAMVAFFINLLASDIPKPEIGFAEQGEGTGFFGAVEVGFEDTR